MKALERAFALLEAVSVDEQLRLRDLADRAGLPVTTTHRLLQSLADLGYVRLSGPREWGLGPRAAWPGRQATRPLTSWARPSLPHCTATGKVPLAQLSLTDPAALLQQLIEVRNQDYAVEDDEREVGVRTIAAPVQGTSHPFALSISGPATRLERHIHSPTALINTVWRVAAQIATQYASTTEPDSCGTVSSEGIDT